VYGCLKVSIQYTMCRTWNEQLQWSFNS